MPTAPLPLNELERLAALHEYDVLDSSCEESFEAIVWLASRITGCPIALISLLDKDRQWFKARVGLEARETHRDMAFCGYAILDPTRPLIVDDATTDPRFADNPLVLGAPHIRAYAGVPLVTPGGHALGTICLIDKQRRTWSEGDLDALTALARSVVTTLELRRATANLRSMTLTDELTRLPNRAAFFDALAAAVENQRRTAQVFSVIFIDLDSFKQINDVHGHVVGDDVLKAVARAIRKAVRRDDLPARLSGDEFAVVLARSDRTAAGFVVARLRESLATLMPDELLLVTASIGVVTFATAPVSESDALAAADAAMYEAKRTGRGGVQFIDYVPSMPDPAAAAAAA